MSNAAYSLVTPILSFAKEEYEYAITTKIHEIRSPLIFHILLHMVASIQVIIPQRRANSAYDLIQPNQDAPPTLIQVRGISRSVPMSAPSAVARIKFQKSIWSIDND